MDRQTDGQTDGQIDLYTESAQRADSVKMAKLCDIHNSPNAKFKFS